MIRRPPKSPLFPSPPLSRSRAAARQRADARLRHGREVVGARGPQLRRQLRAPRPVELVSVRSEEHTSELQSLAYLVCRLLLEKKKKTAKLQLTRHRAAYSID